MSHVSFHQARDMLGAISIEQVGNIISKKLPSFLFPPNEDLIGLLASLRLESNLALENPLKMTPIIHSSPLASRFSE